MIIFKIKLKKIIPFLKKIPRILAENAFLTFLALLFISLAIGGVVFYQYSALTKPTILLTEEEKPLKFKEKIYQEILKIWEEKEKRYEASYYKEYSDPFRGIKKETVEPVATTTPEIEEEQEKNPPTGGEETVSGFSSETIQKLLGTTNLTDFYLIKGEKLPSVRERALIWEKVGLGAAVEYYGSNYQNQKLLEALKKELTP